MCSGAGEAIPQSEFALIHWIRNQAPGNARVALGIGDDCAIVRFPPGALVLATTDMLMDGRHFQLESDGAEAVGYKALAVNLSDIAAMAGLPVAALVSVALPRAEAVRVAQGILAGMKPLAEQFGVALVGGDTNAWDGPLVVSVTLLGEPTPPGPVRRSGARAGDAILITGPIGGSLLGRHLRPKPRVREAQALQRAAAIHAMIDLSDGLASDLGHILEESGNLGAVLDASAIPIHADAVEQSRRDGRPALEHALQDGEDFELCFVLANDDAARLLLSPPEGVSLYRVGEVSASQGLLLRQDSGQLEAIAALGFDHLRAGN
ncbi:MAG TPA: thiamine-phosphate kinase [Isosphaeraceae bacterium]|jgi:thiamine-monophosphate kinase|nr:thiamine-phosphate kinase [Isosphaeraceae bacterium]